jgi:murein DD-endopeptidase MepM/ murein hydrolase activator NlpD
MSRISIYVPQTTAPGLPGPEIAPIDGSRGLLGGLKSIIETIDAKNQREAAARAGTPAAAGNPTDPSSDEVQQPATRKDGVAGPADPNDRAIDAINVKEKQDANAYSANALAKLAEEGLNLAGATPDVGPGHTLDVNNAFEKSVNDAFANAPNDFARQMLTRRLPHLHEQVHRAAVIAEASANIAKRHADAMETLDIFARLAEMNPQRLPGYMAEAAALAQGLALSAAERAQYELKRRELPLAALSTLIDRDPQHALVEMEEGRWSQYVDSETLKRMQTMAEHQITLGQQNVDAESEFNSEHLRLDLGKFGKMLLDGQAISGANPLNSPERFTDVLGDNVTKDASNTLAAQREIGTFFSKAVTSSVNEIQSLAETVNETAKNDRDTAEVVVSGAPADPFLHSEYEQHLQPTAVRSSAGRRAVPSLGRQPRRRQYDAPSPEDINVLLANPQLRNEFEFRFGPAEQYLNHQQLTQLPPRSWDPATMDRPARGRVMGPARWIDEQGNKHPSLDGRLPSGSYRLPDVAPGKALPFEGLVPTRGPGLKTSHYDYYSGVFDPFGLYRGQGGSPRRHTGVDVVAPVGTRVRAMASGIVFVRRDPTNATDLGNVIAVLHPDGSVSMYCHLKDINVRPGDAINAGDEIATVGVSGNAELPRPHLHLEVLAPDSTRASPLDFRKGRRCIDPMEWLQTPMWYRGRPL